MRVALPSLFAIPLFAACVAPTPADVAKLTIYVVNYSPKNLDAIREAAPDFFPQRNPPAGTVIGVQSLPQEGLLIAVDATAVVRAMILPRDQRLQEKPY